MIEEELPSSYIQNGDTYIITRNGIKRPVRNLLIRTVEEERTNTPSYSLTTQQQAAANYPLLTCPICDHICIHNNNNNNNFISTSM